MQKTEDENRIKERILEIKKDLDKELLILTHHYQRKEIVDLGDFKGDSFGLSQKAAADKEARFIVFCGVHFMAESAAILAGPHQTVQIPAVEAGCWMADMADIVTIERAWEDIHSVIDDQSIVPIVYMNSDAELKAFCGRHGGLVCTSSNAAKAFEWGFERHDKIIFFPDQHLGRNSGNSLGIPSEEMIVWNPEKPLGGNTPERIKRARLILWDGYCLVHTRFQVEHIRSMREKYPHAGIVVHPECTEEVVKEADAVGSTSFIVRYVQEAPSKSTIIIGTEINLIDRLSWEHQDKTVLALHNSLCPNMFKINLENLLETLEEIGQKNVVLVPDEVKKEARSALDRMLML
ncbi:MAG: quinolinate synthase NadA [Thermodesulfobacteriota bacterium]|nr:quinolinate synthase NadA [Thermodesulfobacteriota bacterium]